MLDLAFKISILLFPEVIILSLFYLLLTFQRCLDEREKKLEALKTNITQSMAKSTPVRKTKLAYVDSVVKPPRGVAKQQVSHILLLYKCTYLF